MATPQDDEHTPEPESEQTAEALPIVVGPICGVSLIPGRFIVGDQQEGE